MTLDEFCVGFKNHEYCLCIAPETDYTELCKQLDEKLDLDHRHAWYHLNSFEEYVNKYGFEEKHSLKTGLVGICLHQRPRELDGYSILSSDLKSGYVTRILVKECDTIRMKIIYNYEINEGTDELTNSLDKLLKVV